MDNQHEQHYEVTVAVPEPAESSPFVNLISDCLGTIFKRLDLENLLDVASTCEQLRSEVASFFCETSVTKKVTLCHDFTHTPYIYVAKRRRIIGLKSCLAFFRLFGADVSDLTVQWHTWSEYKHFKPMDLPKCVCHTALDQQINRYCAESLTKLSFFDKSEFSSENYTKPFINVEHIRLYHCELADNLSHFINWFPKLHHLKIDPFCNYRFPDNLEDFYLPPHLHHLSIARAGGRIVRKMFRMNPKMQTVFCLNPFGIKPEITRVWNRESALNESNCVKYLA